MILSTITGIKISAIVTAVSNQWQDLNDYYPIMGQDGVEKFRKSTGISGKYKAGLKQTTADFTYAAAKKIIEKKQIDPSTIGAIILVTQTPDYAIPATACVMQMRLGLSKECIAFDVNLGCSGLVYGLQIANSIMITSNIEKTLLLVGDTSGKGQTRNTINAPDNAGKMLFGDAGAALLLEKDPSVEKIIGTFRTDGTRFRAIIKPFGHDRHFEKQDTGSVMDNIGVFNFTIDEVPKQIKEFMNETKTTPEDYDYLIMHQANGYILKQIGKRAGFSKEKILVSIEEYANTSSASIPTALTKFFGNSNEERKIKVLLSGFGVGLSWGTVSATINIQDIFPLVHTDDAWEDGFGEDWKNDYQ